MKRIVDICCIISFLVVVGVFFYPTILQGKLPVPIDALVGLYHPWRDLYSATNPRGLPFKNFLITDPVRQQIPWRKIAIDQWSTGRIPAWNPFSFSGSSLVGNIQAGVFYPLNILFFLFRFSTAWTILIILEPVLAGLFLYIYLRHLRITPLACVFGSVSWIFSGFFIAWLTWGTMVHVALWLPLNLLSVDLLISLERIRNRIAWFFVFVIGLAMQMFAGHIQIAVYCFLIAGAYAAYRVWQIKQRRLGSVLWITAGVAVSALISAIQWIPMVQSIVQSGRITETENWIQPGWFIPWQHLVQFVAPDYFGNPATLNYWGVWNYGELIGYIGVIPLLFAVLSVCSGKKRNDAVFWMIVAGLSLIFALPTPFAYVSYFLRLPVISSLQPTRLLVAVDFSLVMLASFGFDRWLSRREKSVWRSLAIVGVGILILWFTVSPGGDNLLVARRNLMLPTGLFVAGTLLFLISYRARKFFVVFCIGILFVVLTTFDLLRFGWKFTPFSQREYFFPETQVISFLVNQAKPFRIMSLDKRVFPPNSTSYYGIETIEGYDPLMPGRYEELMAAIGRGKPDTSPPFGFNRIITLESVESPLLPLLNVRYVISLSELNKPFLKKVIQEGETRVYEYLSALPRVYIADTVRQVATKEEALRVLFEEVFRSPRPVAVVERNYELGIPRNQLTAGSASVVFYSSNAVVVDAHMVSRAFLVFSENYADGWRVRIDGKDAPLYRVNYSFMGTLVPEGTHRVEFTL
ncbi:YfhO family protein [Candidatus Gottesmanbacteria bacterium]|nr:YfhO family protein [Candidatus Gottesmanbacteria bacterium]